MSAAVITRQFSDPSRVRGEAIARSGAVRSLQVSEQAAAALVTGTADYQVTIEVHHRTASLGCSCPHAASGAFCKHVWATLVLLESETTARTLSAALAQVKSLRLVSRPRSQGDLL